MFKHIRRWFETYKQFLLAQHTIRRNPTVYLIGNKRYIKVKKLRTGLKKRKGPYEK